MNMEPFTQSEIEELKRKALDDDITSLYALECCGRWCIEQSKYEPLTTIGLIGQYLFSMSDNDNALCLSSAFKYGIGVPQDTRMSELLGRAKNISVVETATDGEQYGFLDTDIFSIEFSNEEKDYIIKQIVNIACTIPSLRRDALYCLIDIYTHYFSSGIAKQKKRILFIQICKEYHEEYLLEQILNCVPDDDDEELYWLKTTMKNLPVEHYAGLYIQYADKYPLLYPMIAHLFEYGFCTPGTITADIFQWMYWFALECRRFDDAKLRSRYVCEKVQKGNLLAMAFLDNDPFLMEESQETRIRTLQFLDKQLSKSECTPNPHIVRIFISLCEQYANRKRGTSNPEIKALVEKYDELKSDFVNERKETLDITELPLPKQYPSVDGSYVLLRPEGIAVQPETDGEMCERVIETLKNTAIENFSPSPEYKIKVALQFHSSPRNVDKESIDKVLTQIPSDMFEVIDWGVITDGTDIHRMYYDDVIGNNYVRIFVFIPLELCFRAVTGWLEYNDYLLERICYYFWYGGTKEERRRYLDLFYTFCEKHLIGTGSEEDDNYFSLAKEFAEEFGETERLQESIDLLKQHELEEQQEYERLHPTVVQEEMQEEKQEEPEAPFADCPF